MTQKRLNKILSHAGVASRRAADKLIESGEVKVNAKVVTKLGTVCDPAKDVILVSGKRIGGPEKKVSLLVNKPKGYVCSSKRLGQEKLAIDLVANIKKRVYTVGRLDRDTTGLLIITNDGDLAKKIAHPSSNITKKYLVKAKSEISDEHLKLISKGVYIHGKTYKPASVKKMRRGTLIIGVKEGKKHEVRIMVEEAGLEIFSLSRVSIGNLRLGDLPLGAYRHLTERDIQNIFS